LAIYGYLRIIIYKTGIGHIFEVFFFFFFLDEYSHEIAIVKKFH